MLKHCVFWQLPGFTRKGKFLELPLGGSYMVIGRYLERRCNGNQSISQVMSNHMLVQCKQWLHFCGKGIFHAILEVRLLLPSEGTLALGDFFQETVIFEKS